MIVIHDVPPRNYSNREFTTNAIRIGNIMARQNFWKALLRLEIENVVGQATLTVVYTLQTGGGAHLGGSTTVYTQAGRYEIAINRGDLTDDSTITLELILVGTMRMGASVYFCEVGEDILEWL